MKSLAVMQVENRMASPMNLTWGAIRSRVNHWISDFEFFQFEIVFLEHLLARVAVLATVHENEALVNDVVAKLQNLEMRRDLFARIMKYHRIQVEEIIENPFAYNGQMIKDDHQDIEKRVVEFVNDFRKKKATVYLLVEGTLEPDKIRRLLDVSTERHPIDFE